MARPLTPAELADLLRTETHAQSKPPAVTLGSVLVGVLQSVAAGLGAALLTGGVLYLLQAPAGVIGNTALTAAVIVAGAALVVRAVPADRLLTVRRLQQVQATVIEAEFRKRKAYEAIEALEADYEGRVAELTRSLAEALQDARNARMELRRVQETVTQRRMTFVPKSNVEPQVVRDAQAILRHWFETGAWYSRPKAVAAGWSEDRHAAAVRLLDDAGLVGKAGKLREVQAQSLDVALQKLAAWRESAEVAPLPPNVFYPAESD